MQGGAVRLNVLNLRFRAICAHGRGSSSDLSETFDFGAFLGHLHTLPLHKSQRSAKTHSTARHHHNFKRCPQFNTKIFVSELLFHTVGAPIGLLRSVARIWAYHQRHNTAFQRLLHEHSVVVQRDNMSGHFSFDATIDHVYREVLFDPSRGNYDDRMSEQLVAVDTSPTVKI